MTDAQQGLYLREWGKVRVILRRTLAPQEADAQRHAMHIAALGEDKSSKLFTHADLDKVLKEFRAISQPANFTTQVALECMAATRKRWTIAHLLAALEMGEADLELLISHRQRAGRLVTASPAAAVTCETLGEADLERVMIDLKKKCRARWSRKGDLLTELRVLRMSTDLDEDHTREAVRQALRVDPSTPLPALHDLDYESLLIVLSTLRRPTAKAAPEPTIEIDEPF